MKKPTELQSNIINLLNTGLKGKEVAKKLKCSTVMVSKTKKQFNGMLVNLKSMEITTDTSNFDNDLVEYIKKASLNISTILATKNWQKQSATQLTTALGTLIDKLRLIEGKSTQNILVANFHALDDNTKELIKQGISEYKKLKMSQSTEK